MTITSLRNILRPALTEGYGVPAINVFNDLTLEGVLEAAVAERSPVIVQTSVKTVRSIGSDALWSMWASMTRGIEVPVALHLDHCPDRSVITECLRRGWNSVLFDASALPVEENLRQTIEVVAEARSHGAEVEGEIESITGVEDGIGSDAVAETQPLAVAIDFIERTGIDVFAPAIGNAHGRYRSAPTLDAERVRQIHDATGIPQALHGGSGLSPQQFTELIQAGCAKVNISTALKETYMRASFEHLQRAAASDKWDPPALFTDTKAAVIWMTIQHIRLFGSEGRA
ncbi:MAG: ketose-bisphosphate aldolase [Candidatus Lumbricidophila eiseniae]|uniref:Ketose-bisphosphate aldolase n=1 Tax=Candidatus Lumbricidiphila eiseniae TaxID=1969409 RepID=A0A2A6FMP4_9MICO|nr:MAG: ketose-bisphosphate aldolase [Candidatus Lumbricidophila eiseniae]